MDEVKARILNLLINAGTNNITAARKVFDSEVTTLWFAEYDFDKVAFRIDSAEAIIYDMCRAYYKTFNKLPSVEIVNLEVQKQPSIDILKKQKVYELLYLITALEVTEDEVDYLKFKLKESYARNELTKHSQKILEQLKTDPVGAVRQANRDITYLNNSLATHSKGSETLWLGDMIESYQENVMAGKSFIENMVPYPFPSWNKMLGGMRPGELIVLAASHNIGKSFMLHEIAWGASSMGYNTVCAELEMLNGPLMQRLAACMSGIPSRKIEEAALTDLDKKLLNAAMTRVKESAQAKKMLFVQNNKCTTPAMLRAEIEQAYGDEVPRLVMIDYFDKMRPSKSNSHMDSTAAKSELCDELADTIGKYFEVPILTAVHLNKDENVKYQFMLQKADTILEGSFDDAYPYIPPSNQGDDWIGKPGKLDWRINRNRNGVKAKDITLSVAVEFATSSVTEWLGNQSSVPAPSQEKQAASTLFTGVDLNTETPTPVRFED